MTTDVRLTVGVTGLIVVGRSGLVMLSATDGALASEVSDEGGMKTSMSAPIPFGVLPALLWAAAPTTLTATTAATVAPDASHTRSLGRGPALVGMRTGTSSHLGHLSKIRALGSPPLPRPPNPHPVRTRELVAKTAWAIHGGPTPPGEPIPAKMTSTDLVGLSISAAFADVWLLGTQQRLPLRWCT